MPKHHQSKPEPEEIPQRINPNLRRKPKKQKLAADILVGIRNSDRVVLGQAITLIESTLDTDRKLAAEIVEACLPHSGNSFRLGITGTPGVGKSTFIAAFGADLVAKGHKVAILAVDPSSQRTKGSILGDKTRMGELVSDDNVFIRPSPAGATLGGVAHRTREAILLCEAAGYDFILIETVGVGQSEVAVHALSDFFMLLLLPGAGDELQGIKRGVMEMADLIVVNKSDGERKLAGQKARAIYQKALHLFPPKQSGWAAKAITCSALKKTGFEQIHDLLMQFKEQTKITNHFIQNRHQQAKYWLHQRLKETIMLDFFQHPSIKKNIDEIENQVINGKRSTSAAADLLLSQWKKSNNGHEDVRI